MKRGGGVAPPVKSLGEKRKICISIRNTYIFNGGEDDACLANLLEKALWRKRLERAYFGTWLC